MRLTVAVCTYRRFDYLKSCLESLEKQTISQTEYTILVIDNSLQPEYSAVFRDSLQKFSNIEYVITERCGIGFARTQAMKRCQTEFLAFTDDDCVVPINWAQTILETFSRHNQAVAVIGGRILPLWESSPPGWLTGELLKELALIDWGRHETFISHAQGRWLLTANAAYRVAALRQAGGFPEHLGRKRDIPLSQEEYAANQRLQELGFHMIFNPNLEVRHHIPAERATKKWFVRSAFWEGVSQALYASSDMDDTDSGQLIQNLIPVQDRLLEHDDKGLSDHTLGSMLQETRKGGYLAAQKHIAGNSEMRDRSDHFWPVVYVLTPSRNAVETIDDTILSVVTQLGDFSIRYHVQDGQSTDGTLEKLESWQICLDNPENPYIRCRNVVFTYASEPDTGMYNAIKRGFSCMEIPPQAFMTWINADDVLIQTACALILDASKECPDLDWVGGSVAAFQETNHLYFYAPIGFPREIIQSGACDGSNWQFIQQEGCFFRKKLWTVVGGLDDSFQFAGDWDLWRRMSQHSEFVQFQCPLGIFRKRPGQISSLDHGRSYTAEIDKTISFSTRKAALAALVEKGRNNTYINVLTVKQENLGYKVYKEPLGDRVAGQSLSFFQKHYRDSSLQYTEFSKKNIVRNNISLLDSPLFHRVYNDLPSIFQKLLTKIKYSVILKSIQAVARFNQYRILKKSHLFWYTYYLKQYPDVAQSGLDPLTHFITHGWRERRRPNPLFDTEWYLQTYPDVSAEGSQNPLVHFVRHGAKEGRDPGPCFSTAAYLQKMKAADKKWMNPLEHFFRFGMTDSTEALFCDKNTIC